MKWEVLHKRFEIYAARDLRFTIFQKFYSNSIHAPGAKPIMFKVP